MLRPISAAEPELPDDVREFARSLHEKNSAPRTIDVLPPRMPYSSFVGPSGGMLGGLASDRGVLGEAPSPVGAKVPVLECWSVQAHVYSSEVAAKLGLFAGLFGGSAKRAKVGATYEAKRYTYESTAEDTSVQVGVAVRLAVATTEWDVDFELSVPNIAAAAQLNMKVGDARIGIDVVGYSGPLGDVLPTPRQLDVRSLADYLTAFAEIQHQVFGIEGLTLLTPTCLSYEDGGDEAPTASRQ